MANTKISQLTNLTTPTGSEEFVYAYNNANGKVTLDTMKSFIGSGGAIENAYDAVVDASGNGDYLLVSAAISAGKYNIFVKNGSYTETAGRDPYTNNKSFLRVVGESKEGVQISFPSTITTPNNIFIDMRYDNNANFYMENISLDVSLSSNNNRLYDDNGGDAMIKNCSFTYSGANNNTLLNSAVLLDKMRIVNCDFISTTSNEVNICNNDYSAYGCNFSSNSGMISLSSSDKVRLYNCNINTYSLGGVSQLQLFNSKLNVSGGVISGDLSMDHVCDSEVNISALQSTPSLIEAAVADNSIINVSGYDFNLGNAYGSERGACNCYIKAANITNPVLVNNCVFETTSSFSVGSNNVVSGCRFLSSTTVITVTNNSNFIGNRVYGTGTITLTSKDNIVVGNNMPNFTIVDNSTGNIKDNNVTAA